MVARLELVRDDYGYDLTITIKDAQNSAVDLNNVQQIKFMVKKQGATSLQVDTTDVSVYDADNGIVNYTVKEEDFDTIGKYDAELQVTWTGGKILTAQDLQIDVLPDLG